MAWFESLKELLATFAASNLPHELPVEYSSLSAVAGATAGRFLLERTASSFTYRFHETPAGVRRRVEAELVRGHDLSDLGSLYSYLEAMEDPAVAFVAVKEARPAEVLVLLDEARPELGLLRYHVARHPAWSRWLEGMGGGGLIDRSHHELADTLLDNREDLEDPAVALVLAQFRSAKTVEYDADLGDAGHEGLRVTWKGSGGAKGPQGQVEVPREFTARLPAYTGPWAPGEEPRHLARFRLRVLPGDPEPVFRCSWVNFADYELEASRALLEAIRIGLAGTPVYAGTPDVQHFYTLKDPQEDSR